MPFVPTGVTGTGVQGAETIVELKPVGELTADDAFKWPYLSGCGLLAVPAEQRESISKLVRGQLAVAMHDADGAALSCTGLQIQVRGIVDGGCALNGCVAFLL